MQLDTFFPEYYSTTDCAKLISIGLNPKFTLYGDDEQKRRNDHNRYTERLGEIYSNLIGDYWYSPRNLKCFFQLSPFDCLSDCKDKKEAFYFDLGFRIEKSEKVGEGGFGEVWKGEIHGKLKAVKFVDISQSYRENVIRGNGGSITGVVSGLFGSSASEANIYLGGKLDHRNILNLDEFWFQMSGLDDEMSGKGKAKIELALASRLCCYNLAQWRKNEKYDFGQLRDFLIQITDALHHLAKKKIIHRDMKLENVLITERSKPVAMLTDFGLANPDVNGLTPGQCAPEQLERKSKVGKTDLFALGISIILTLFEEKIGLALLFYPIGDVPKAIVEEFGRNKLIQLVRKMVMYEPNDRINFDEVRNELENLDPSSAVINLESDIVSDISKLGLTLAQLSIVDKSIILPSQAPSDLISIQVRDQKESGLCWAFSAAKLLTAELRKFIIQLRDTGLVSSSAANEALLLASTLNEGNRLVQEITCLVVPRDPKMVEISNEKMMSQMAVLKSQIKKMCQKTILKSEGWKMLPSLVNVVKIIIDGSQISSMDEIELLTETFHHPMSESVQKVLTILKKPDPSWFKFNGKLFRVKHLNF